MAFFASYPKWFTAWMTVKGTRARISLWCLLLGMLIVRKSRLSCLKVPCTGTGTPSPRKPSGIFWLKSQEGPGSAALSRMDCFRRALWTLVPFAGWLMATARRSTMY